MDQRDPTSMQNMLAEPPASPIGEAYAAAALQQVRAAVRGNGIKPDDLRLQKITGDVAEFNAVTTLTLRVRTMEKVVSGKKTVGEKVDGPQGVQGALDKERNRILSSPDILGRIKTMILERKDKGFGVRNEVIKLPFLTKEYVHHQPCRTCGAQGKLKCQRCHARGYETCPRCNGQSMEMCPQCRGAQLVHMGNGKQPCPRCNGQGRTPCMMCNQTRRVACPTCATKGFTACPNCNGASWHSYVTLAEMDVIGNFSFDRERVPAKLVNFIETRAKELPEYADVAPLAPQPKNPEEQQAQSDDIPVDFHVRLPYADAEIVLGKEAKAHLFLMGTRGQIADTTAFLEPLMKRGIEMLRDAAEGRGSVAKKIHRACKYRTIRQAIIASTKYSKSKAARLLMKNNPIGISPGTVKALVTDADTAMKNITAGPRRNGVFAGALIATALYALYLLTPARATLTGFVNNESLHLAIDGVAMGIGMLFAVFTIQLFGARAIKKALGKLLGPDQQNSITSKAGHSGLYSALLCLAMFMVICEISIHTHTAPDWYETIRGITTSTAKLTN